MGDLTPLVAALLVMAGPAAPPASPSAPEPNAPGTPPARAEAPGVGQTQTLSLGECVRRALARGHDLAAKDLVVRGAEADRKATRGNLGPKLRIESGVQVWDSPLTTRFDVGDLPIQVPPMKVRDQVTWSLSVMIVQPLTGLWTIFEASEVKALGVDVAKLDRDLARRDRALQVAQVYLGLQQLERLEVVAEQSLRQRRGQVERASALFERGVVQRNDLLRARLGLADGRNRVIEAGRNLALMRARLAMLLGLPQGVLIRPKGPPPSLGSLAPLPSVEVATARALERRLALKRLRQQVEQARHGVRIARSKMLPDVALVGAYQKTGGSEFQQADAFFLGLSLKWNVWEWGATWFGIDAAGARARAAAQGLSMLEDAVRLEVRKALTEARSAEDLLAVAKEAVVQAVENYRLATKRYERQAATSFDVLDAETLLTQARVRYEAGIYQVLAARAALARTMGAGPEEIIREVEP